MKWTKENCLSAALKCSSKTEFTKRFRGAYATARIKGWLEDICKHMSVSGTFSKRAVYVYKFPDNHIYVGLTCDVKRRLKEHSERNNHHDPVWSHKEATQLDPTFEVLTEYIEATEAQRIERETQERFSNEGWIALHKAQAGGLGGNIRKWNEKSAIDAVFMGGFKNRVQVYREMPGLYRAIVNNKWHHILPVKK